VQLRPCWWMRHSKPGWLASNPFASIQPPQEATPTFWQV